MAKSPYDVIAGRSTRLSPYKVPGTTPFTGGEQIQSHPLYRHRLNKRYMKRRMSTGQAGASEGGYRYKKPGYDPESGLTRGQWQDITREGGVGASTFADPESSIAPVMHGGRWYSQADIDPTTGEPKEGTGGYGGRSVRGTLMYEGENWRGAYEGGGYGYPSWGKGWYEPARHIGLEKPLEQTREEEFREVSGLGFNLPEAGSPYDLGLEADARIQSDIVPDLLGMTAAGEAAREQYLGVVEDLYGVGGTVEQLEEERLQEKRGLREQRQDIIEGRYPGFEQAQAVRAQTGMAYSGPAERAISFGKEQEAKELRGITQTERKLQTEYEKGQEEILGAQEEAYKAYAGPTGALGEYWGDVMGIFGPEQGGAQERAQTSVQLGLDLMEDWQGWGAETGLGSVGATHGGGGILPSGSDRYFGEISAGEYSPYKTLFDIGTAAETSAQAVYDRAVEQYAGLSAELPSGLAGQTGGV